MKHSKISFAIGIFLLSSNFADASSMRCSRGIASEGDTRQEVIDKCGEPINKEIWEPGVRNQNTKTPKKGAAHVEFWTYGPDGGVYRKLRFIDDRLVQVEIIWK
ncbi:DUF2845 domain-containing protein [Pseudomonas citronellolis]|uniref:DUF2845 domain-containing protein n=2 Tax=Pseudomonas citronellolis TaxID=53408 RepID=UPI003C2EDA8B